MTTAAQEKMDDGRNQQGGEGEKNVSVSHPGRVELLLQDQTDGVGRAGVLAEALFPSQEKSNSGLRHRQPH